MIMNLSSAEHGVPNMIMKLSWAENGLPNMIMTLSSAEHGGSEHDHKIIIGQFGPTKKNR